jgi:phosphohistidine phosphatase
MIVTIWRHGEAGRAATDRQRELTDRGLDDLGFGCSQFHEALAARGIAPPELILYSPWTRTRQTAEIIASAFTHASRREEATLQPGGTVTAVQQCLSTLRDATGGANPAHVVLVTHQPLVSELVMFFLGPASSVPSLSPGALVTFALDVTARDCGDLVFWAVPPEYGFGL